MVRAKSRAVRARTRARAPERRRVWLAQAATKVATYLQDRGEIGASPKEIAKNARVPLRTVYKALKVLLRQGKVVKEFRGRFRSKESIPEIIRRSQGRVGFHGIVLKGANWPLRQNDPPGPPHPAGPAPLGDFGTWVETADGAWEAYGEFLRRRVRFRWWGESRTLMVYMSTSKEPLTFDEVARMDGWLGAKTHPVDHGSKLYFVEVTANIDYKDWKLDGIRSIRWNRWMNGMLSLYQKNQKLGMRAELEQHPREVSFKEGIDLILSLDPKSQLARAELAMARALERFRQEEKMPKKSEEKGIPGPALGVDSYPTGYG